MADPRREELRSTTPEPSLIDSEQPVAAAEFAALMEAADPFESAPRIATGLSGGADSLALTVLLHDWARERNGQLVALTVDHGLRTDSMAEAVRMAAVCGAQGIAHRILRWTGAKPVASIQAEAREARYGLLRRFCARDRILHLCVAHHREDQAETLLLRLARGSGLAGLCGMPVVSEGAGCRLIRPLLTVPKRRLEVTLAARGVDWMEDPSNRNRAFARVRMRDLMPSLAAEGLSARRLAATAGRLGRARRALEEMASEVLAEAATTDPAGFVELNPGPLLRAPEEVSLRALGACLMTVGGLSAPVRFERLQRLHARLRDYRDSNDYDGGPDRGMTLGGCRILPRGRALLLVREPGRTARTEARPGVLNLWDRRFVWRLGRLRGAKTGPLAIGALGGGGWAEIKGSDQFAAVRKLPAPVRAAVPALWDARGLAVVPHLGYRRNDWASQEVGKCCFAPQNPLTPPAFTVV